MVNFRFHVVSIIAIFLAIAIGTVLGSAFVGRGIVDNLQNQIDTVRSSADAVRSKNASLADRNDELGRYIDQTAVYAVGRSLAGVRVDLVAERGVDGAVVDEQAQLLRQAGATVPGVVWLEDTWDLSGNDEPGALRIATGLSNRSAATLRSAAAGLLGRRLATSPVVGADDVLVGLALGKFVTLSGVGGSPPPTAADFTGDLARTLVIGGPAESIPPGVVAEMAAGMVDGEAAFAVGQVYAQSEEHPNREEWIDAIANTDALRGHLSTIDDVDVTAGRVAATLALAELGTGTTGNYGLGRNQTVPDKAVTAPAAR